MEHSFDIKIAKEYGIEEAIILKNIYFWVQKILQTKSIFMMGNIGLTTARKHLRNYSHT